MLSFDPLSNPYRLPRTPVYAHRGMVATSQPYAAQAGLSILQQGGNAIDAAVAAAAALTVVEPTSNGIGGDAFALIWSQGKLHGLNSSGPAPMGISIDAITNRGFSTMPGSGWESVTTPGIPAAWASLVARFGRLPLSQVIAPAVELATKGYAVSPVLSYYWQRAFERYTTKLKQPQFQNWFRTFAPLGRAPRPGEMWASPDHGETLKEIGRTNAEAFYRGSLADRIDSFSRQNQGFLRKEDLATFSPEWVEPISVDFRGYDVWEIPPNGQGISALMALKILNKFPPAANEDEKAYHRAIEAIKLAMTDGNTYITQRNLMTVTTDDLLSDSYAETRKNLIGERALQPTPGEPHAGGTVYLATADNEGNMVSYIQSNYEGFGSALVVPGTGIALQNRGCNFSLDPNHANCLAPGKRTFHTIIPGFITKDRLPVGPFGVMGGFNQPQAHVQVVMNSIDRHLNPQAALDAPRWRWMNDKTVLVESHFPKTIVGALSARGHDVQISQDVGAFGRGQIIWRDSESGVLAGATESRTDGMVAVW